MSHHAVATARGYGKNGGDGLPDWGMAFATLAAADRLLVRGEPVGALLDASCEQHTRRYLPGALVPSFRQTKRK